MNVLKDVRNACICIKWFTYLNHNFLKTCQEISVQNSAMPPDKCYAKMD